MSIGRAGVFGCVALLGTVVAASSFTREAADRAVCDSKGKVANLNFTLKDMNGKNVALFVQGPCHPAGLLGDLVWSLQD